jgi:cyclopropane-fatty-acyl-phospholipid synthase
VHALGFGDTFVRMWELYLAYCEAGFATGAIGDEQLRLERG